MDFLASRLRYFQTISVVILTAATTALPVKAALALPSTETTSSRVSASSETARSSASQTKYVPQSVLEAVNRIDTATVPTLPGLDSAEPFLPAPDPFAQVHLLIKLSERRVYVYNKDQVEASFPVAIGRAGWETPVGRHQVIQMLHDPTWQHPFTGALIPPGPDNPLGARWIAFWTDGKNYVGFHGTPNENSVGRPASHGCVRMYNRDVIKLFEMVRIGTPVDVVP
jgi:lipoprotein-anchoring transpeptidase ErfK/SrfK